MNFIKVGSVVLQETPLKFFMVSCHGTKVAVIVIKNFTYMKSVHY